MLRPMTSDRYDVPGAVARKSSILVMICGVPLVKSRDKAVRSPDGHTAAFDEGLPFASGLYGLSSYVVSSATHSVMQDITRSTKRSGTGTGWKETSDISHPFRPRFASF